MQRQPSQVLRFRYDWTGSCLSHAPCRAKEQHALLGKCRKHQISDWVPLDHMTIHLRGCLTDWVTLYPLGQHASGSEEEEGDLPNLWPVRVAYATYLAVSQPCLLLGAVQHCACHDSVMCTVQLVRQADYWTHWMQALDDVEHESVFGALACGSTHLHSRCSDCCITALTRGARSFRSSGIRCALLTCKLSPYCAGCHP